MNTDNSYAAKIPPYSSSKRVVLITGPTAGLGRGIALELARQRYQLVLLGRNPDKLKALSEQIIAAGAPEPMQLVCDMNSQKQVRQAAARYLESGWPLHVLINNAGLVNLKRRVTEDGLEESSAIACWSAFLLTMLLLPRLKDSAPSAIINTSSDTYPRGQIPFDDPSFKKNFNMLGCYEAAKLSNTYLTLRLAKMLKPYRIGVNIYNPGMIRTDLVSSNRKGLLRRLKIVFLADKIYRLVSKPIAKGIKAPVELATAAQLDAITGKFYNYNKETAVKPVALDEFTSNALWVFSQALTGYPVPDFLSDDKPVPAAPGKIRIGVMGAAKIAPYSIFKHAS
jgi:NAD(P)-dependent dehydrogenase (short-subunit alcohol dehydrogenase family)